MVSLEAVVLVVVPVTAAFFSGYLLARAHKTPEDVIIPQLKLLTKIKTPLSAREISKIVQYQEFQDELMKLLHQRFPLTIDQLKTIASEIEYLILKELGGKGE